jgi:hypothetical protein
MKRTVWVILMAFSVAIGACSKKSASLAEYPIPNMDGVITQTDVVFDPAVSSDGNGSLRITAAAPATVRLFETGDLNVENARLIYRAHLRTADVEGKVYLEMWCSFPGKGEFFSRALQAPLSGTVEWTSQETPFFLKAGENPDNVKLNLVLDGKGTAWIDDVQLMKGPLDSQ